MSFAISTNGGSDFDLHYVAKNHIYILSMRFVIDNGRRVAEYYYGNGEPELGAKEFYSLIRNAVYASSISATVDETYNHFVKLYNEGQTQILQITLASGLSDNHANALVAAKRFNALHHDCNVVVIDSKQISLGLALLVDSIVKFRDAGKSLDETVAWIEANKLFYRTFLTLSDTTCLSRSQRAPKLVEFLGSDHTSEPIASLSADGEVVPLDKCETRDIAIRRVAELVGEHLRSQDDKVFIAHGDCREDAEILRGVLERTLGAKNIHIGIIGPIIGASGGPDLLAVSFVGKDQRNGI